MVGKGLVLEGGGMRGIFTAGVLDFFLDKNITFNTCIGVSAGSCHAASYLSGQRGRAFAVGTEYLSDPEYCSVQSLLKTGDLFGADFCYHKIPDELNLYDYDAFNKNPCDFYAVVTNCETGKAVYQKITDMHEGVEYIRASSSMPLVSRVVHLDGRPYLDGGIADSIPLLKSQHLGNDKNVVVLTQAPGYRKKPNKLAPAVRARYPQYPNLAKAMATRYLHYNETLAMIEKKASHGEVFVIRPQETLPLGRVEHDPARLRAAYQAGYEEAKRRYTALLLYLEGAY